MSEIAEKDQAKEEKIFLNDESMEEKRLARQVRSAKKLLRQANNNLMLAEYEHLSYIGPRLNKEMILEKSFLVLNVLDKTAYKLYTRKFLILYGTYLGVKDRVIQLWREIHCLDTDCFDPDYLADKNLKNISRISPRNNLMTRRTMSR